MQRRPVRRSDLVWVLGLALSVAWGASAVFAAEQRQTVQLGAHLRFGSLTQLGSMSFLYRDDGAGAPAAFSITGDEAATDRIDGRNHDVNGNLVGSGDRAGIALDVAASALTVDGRETIQGTLSIQAQVPSVDVPSYVHVLLENANLTYTSNTTLNNQTIGDPAHYQIVVVKDCKLTLKGASTGYGVLVVYDSTATGGNAKLELEDTSKWYGVILFYSGNSSSNDQRFALGKHSGDCSSGGGSGKGKGGSWLPSQTPWWQRALTMLSGERSAFADDSSGKGKGASSCAAGSGVQVIGAVIARGYQFKISAPTGGLYDIFYSSTAVNNVDNMLGNTKFTWEKWRER